MWTKSTEALAQSARISAVSMCAAAKAAHIGSSLSVIDILAVIYGEVARVTPETATESGRDIVVMSKGHAAAGLYAVLAHRGYFPLDWLDSYCRDGSLLGGHVTSHGVPGVEFSTGSLGHALAFATGMAISGQRSGALPRQFVVMSDGECDEGSNWEAALLAAHHMLGKLSVIIDRNGLQSLATTEETLRLEPLADKWCAFGWDVREVDGHNHSQLRSALMDEGDRPIAIIADTIKGRGVDFMENSVEWHYKSPSSEQLFDAVSQLSGP